MNYNLIYYFKFFIFISCFYNCYSDNTSNICRRLNVSRYNPFTKQTSQTSHTSHTSYTSYTSYTIYYCSKNRSITRHNPYAVFAKDILRKYIYIINIVVVYIILLSI